MPAVPFKKRLASDTEQCLDHAVAACLIRTGRDGHPPLSLPSWGCHCAVAVNKVIYLISFTCHCLSRAIKSRANRRNDMEHGKKQRKHEKEKGHEQKGCVFRRLDLIMEMLQSSYGTVILQEFGWILDVESFVLKKGLHRIFFSTYRIQTVRNFSIVPLHQSKPNDFSNAENLGFGETCTKVMKKLYQTCLFVDWCSLFQLEATHC